MSIQSEQWHARTWHNALANARKATAQRRKATKQPRNARTVAAVSARTVFSLVECVLARPVAPDDVQPLALSLPTQPTKTANAARGESSPWARQRGSGAVRRGVARKVKVKVKGVRVRVLPLLLACSLLPLRCLL